jgi:hypothetical protein
VCSTLLTSMSERITNCLVDNALIRPYSDLDTGGEFLPNIVGGQDLAGGLTRMAKVRRRRVSGTKPVRLKISPTVERAGNGQLG